MRKRCFNCHHCGRHGFVHRWRSIDRDGQLVCWHDKPVAGISFSGGCIGRVCGGDAHGRDGSDYVCEPIERY